MRYPGFVGVLLRWASAVRQRTLSALGGRAIGLAAVLVTIATALLANATVNPGTDVQPGRAAAAVAGYPSLPLSFEPNRGQTDGEVRFLARVPGCTAWLTPQEVVLGLRAPGRAARDGRDARAGGEHVAVSPFRLDVVRLRWVGAKIAPELTGLDVRGGASNYLLGDDPTAWLTGVPHFARVRYAGVYPGIDVELYGAEQRLEYDFVVAPGRDPRQIELELAGARSVRVRSDGDLELRLAHGTLVQHRPLVYQNTAAGRREVRGEYVRRGRNRIGFTVGRYDRALPLVIDPVLSYATYLGGSDADLAMGVALGSGGEVYLTGGTSSANFPVKGAFQTAFGGSEDVFVTKLDAAGATLVYSTFLGASSNERGMSIAVDGNGKAIVTGFTQSTNFPLKNAFQSTSGTNTDAFVAKLAASGAALEFSTYLGGSGYDYAYAVATDSGGAAYVTGFTESTNFPTASAFDTTHNGDRDVFVTKLAAAGTMVYSTLLGGSGRDEGHGIAVAASGHAYVTGYTGSSNFPLVGAYQLTPAGPPYEAFVTKLAPAGNALTYSTFLGGNSEDYGTAIAVDGSGQAVVVGHTWSSTFPTVNPFQATKVGNRDAFVTKLNAAGNGLLYSSYLGGSSPDYAYGVAISSGGVAYITGETSSTDFPTSQPQQATYGGGASDAFLTAVSVSGSAIEYSTFLGGSVADVGWAVAQTGGAVVVAGQTTSTNFPVANAYTPTYRGGSSDAFLAKLTFGETYPYRYWIPSASRAAGSGGSQWRTDLGVLNANGARSDLELVFYSSTQRTGTAFVAGASQSILVDVVGQLGGSGSAALEVRSALPVRVSSRTYNLNTAGAQCYPNATLGQNLDALTVPQGLATGESAFLTQLVENAAFRTNISVTNMSAAAATAKVELFDGAGTKLTEYPVSLNAGQFKQEAKPFFAKAGQTNMSRGYAKITVTAGAGVVAYASVIDNVTQDPTTGAMQR